MKKKMGNKKSKFAGRLARSAQNNKKRGGYFKALSGVNLFKEEDGRAMLDIIPYIVSDPSHPEKMDGYPEKGDEWFRRPFKVHRVGSDNRKIVCPTSFGKKCPICEYRSKILANEGNTDEAKKLKPSKRALYNVIPIGNAKHEEKVHLWDISDYCFYSLLTEDLEEDESLECFPDLEEGLTLSIRFSPDSVGGDAAARTFPKATKITYEERQSYDRSILNETVDLDKVLDLKSYEEIEKLFFDLDDDASTENEETEEEEEDTPPPAKIARKGRTVKSPPKEQVEELEEEYEENENEEEELDALDALDSVELDDDDEEEELDDLDEEEEAPPIIQRKKGGIPVKKKR